MRLMSKRSIAVHGRLSSSDNAAAGWKISPQEEVDGDAEYGNLAEETAKRKRRRFRPQSLLIKLAIVMSDPGKSTLTNRILAKSVVVYDMPA